ncbi:MAG: ABC transporter permease subunit [Acidimicrobiia bacterium]|nr:ABC transporter permease [Acidimicrobiia bacterium]NNF68521.1 ABC transporter permease subunit [Acidimicrobiia bacterium]
MLRTYKSELIRFRRTALIGAGIMAAFTALITTLTFVGFDEPTGPGAGRGPGSVVTDLASIDGLMAGLASAATMIGIVALALFATSVARDYERGTIRQLLVGEPRRAFVLGGKLAALVTVVVAGVAVSAIIGIGAAFALAPIADVSTAAWTTNAAVSAAISTAVNVTIATMVWGLAGAVLAMVTRSASTAITAGIGYLLVGEPLLTLVWDTSSDWLVSGTLSTFTDGGTALVSYGQSAVLLTLYAATFVAATFVVFSRRDITD